MNVYFSLFCRSRITTKLTCQLGDLPELSCHSLRASRAHNANVRLLRLICIQYATGYTVYLLFAYSTLQATLVTSTVYLMNSGTPRCCSVVRRNESLSPVLKIGCWLCSRYRAPLRAASPSMSIDTRLDVPLFGSRLVHTVTS